MVIGELVGGVIEGIVGGAVKIAELGGRAAEYAHDNPKKAAAIGAGLIVAGGAVYGAVRAVDHYQQSKLPNQAVELHKAASGSPLEFQFNEERAMVRGAEGLRLSFEYNPHWEDTEFGLPGLSDFKSIKRISGSVVNNLTAYEVFEDNEPLGVVDDTDRYGIQVRNNDGTVHGEAKLRPVTDLAFSKREAMRDTLQSLIEAAQGSKY